MEAPAPPDADDRLLRLARRWPGLAAWAVLALATAVLIGWLLGVQELKAPLPGLPSMKANTAIAFILTALGILLHGHRRRWFGVSAASGAGLIGALTLAEYLLGVQLGVDEALVRDDLGAIATSTPGRMSVLTAFCFVLVSSALLAARGRGTGMVREGLAAGVVFVATFVLGSYAYGAVVISGYTQVALHTAISFLLLGPAVILLRPEGMLARALLSTRLDGMLARRLLPATIVIPLLLGWIRISLQDAGLVDTGTGAALFAAAMVVVLVTLVILSLARLRAALQRAEQADAQRRAADAELVRAARRMDEAERVTGRGSWEWDVTTDRAIWSEGMYRLFGLDRATFANTNENFLALVHPDDRARMGQAIADALARPGQFLQEYRLRRPDGRELAVRGEGDVVVDGQGQARRLFGFVQDVTELRAAEEQRRTAEQAVAASEARLKQIFEASPTGLILARRDGSVVDVNPAAEALWGRPRSDFFSPGFSMAQLYEDPSQREGVIRDLQARGRTEGLELRMRRGDGQVRTMSFNVVLIQHGGAPAFLASGLDITDLRASEARVKESEARLRAVLDNASDAIVTGDATAAIVGWNRAAERIFGWSTAEAMGRPISDLMPPAQWNDYQQDIAQFMQGKPSRYLGRAREMAAVRKDRSSIDVELSLAIWQGAAGPMFTGVIRDITERKKAQVETQRATERFERVFHASPVPICLTKEDGRFIDVNDAFCALVARSRESLVGGDVKAVDVWEDPQERQRMLIAIRERGVVRDLELRVKRPDGEVRATLASIEFIDLGGTTTILSLLQDVTDRLRMQDEREARIASEAELERMRRTEAFRNEFINNIAHELATPLTPLVLKTRTLLADRGLSPTQHAMAEVIDRNVQRLRHLVDEMVGAADLQARTLALDRRRLNLTRELRAAVAAHHPAAERAGLTMDEPEDTGLTVSADSARLQLVLGHLLGNAIKFTPTGGRVTVSSRRVGDEVRIEVKDTGAGLTRKQMDGLWRPFAQAHDKSQKTDSGSGLGLYVTKGIIELHGGEVGCNSPGPGQGSTFWFTLPLAVGHVDPLAKRPKEDPAPSEPQRNLNPGARPDDPV